MGFPDYTLRMAVLDFVNSSSDEASENAHPTSHCPNRQKNRSFSLFMSCCLLPALWWTAHVSLLAVKVVLKHKPDLQQAYGLIKNRMAFWSMFFLLIIDILFVSHESEIHCLSVLDHRPQFNSQQHHGFVSAAQTHHSSPAGWVLVKTTHLSHTICAVN